MFSGGCTENIPGPCSEHLKLLHAALDYYGTWYYEFYKSMNFVCHNSIGCLSLLYTQNISVLAQSLWIRRLSFSGQGIASILPPAADQQWGTLQHTVECCSPILSLYHGLGTKLEYQNCQTGSVWAHPLNSMSLLRWKIRLDASQWDTDTKQPFKKQKQRIKIIRCYQETLMS